MEEESIEHDLEERMYAALHYVDETQPEIPNQKEITPNFDNVQQTNIRRYWRTNEHVTTCYSKVNKSHNKVNTPTNKVNTPNKKETDKIPSKSKDKPALNSGGEVSLFQQPIPDNVKKTIEILETEDKNSVVELESSDEDEVIEIALPPKPTITIESSDEEDICVSSKSTKEKEGIDAKSSNDQDRISSPVPSTVSSISDEFIRSDCIALNISSRHSDNTFDYTSHGSDVEQTPSKKRKKRKIADASSTPISSKSPEINEGFATPKSKAKNKKQKTKSYQVSNISIPSADVYDSDSNQSIVESNKSGNYKVTDKSLPNTDVYETDSNHSENVKDSPIKSTDIMVSDIDTSEHLSEGENQAPDIPNIVPEQERRKSVIDLTEVDCIEESIVMANVTGFSNQEDDNYENLVPKTSPSKCGSTKIPAILYEDLDFDNLKGNKVYKRRRYSLTALRAEMDKFYNESWGGEDFNHYEIQKNMSRDKSLWAIDPRDRMPALARRKTICNICNRVGHRDDVCRLKTPICYMCGSTGHYEPRCPKKICVNCGSPNHIYTTMCRNCTNWSSIRCAECGQNGHPSSHCPDVWRRYHNTLNVDVPLEENRHMKKHYQMFCSGCTRRGHLINTCRQTLPFSGLPIYSPYVMLYRPVYSSTRNENSTQNTDPNNQKNRQKKNIQEPITNTPKTNCNKRKSKSPVANEFMNKKRNLVSSDAPENSPNSQQKKTVNKENTSDSYVETNKNTNKTSDKKDANTESAADFIAVSSSNHDKKGHIIQDNEVSGTSEVITSARIYITNEICNSLRTSDGKDWLKQTATKNNITVENTDSNFYISIKGSVGNQEAFQSELRDWIKSKQPVKESRISESDANSTIEFNNQSLSDNIPKNRNNVLRKLSKALDSLKSDIGDPKALYKELTYLQNRQQQLIKQNKVSPKQLSNNRGNIDVMLKKLNMVLIGQAGLADGSKHLRELHSLQDKLTNFRNKNIPTSLRQEIGEHFHCIFTAIPRDDYEELIRKYYNKNPIQTVGKIRKRKQLKMSPHMLQNNKINGKFSPKNIINTKRQGDDQSSYKTRNLDKARSRLIYFHSRIMNIKPVNSLLKKAKGQMMNKLHCNIASMSNITNVSGKDLFQARKVQEEAKHLLRNLVSMPKN